MCGIAGIVSHGGDNVSPAQAILDMVKSLVHRGPDGAGTWLDAAAGIALGHRRLSVLDLSPAAGQPMVSRSGRLVLVLNGEIYNHRELRRELENVNCPGLPWRGHSDTEVLLAAIETWGLEKTLPKCLGMFAFALWDTLDRRLSLVRDRLGEKPLYYGWVRGSFLFGSELKALRAFPGFDPEVNRHALDLLLRNGFIPAPHSIYRGILKLPPGAVMTLQVESLSPGVLDPPRFYWEIRKAMEAGTEAPFPGDEEEAIDCLDNLLCSAVEGQMCADVPLGAFLSGGVDSSLIVALMQRQSRSRVKTFTVGFEESQFNEAQHAEAVADYLGTDHTTVYLGRRDSLGVIEDLPLLYDEPFADSSQIPTCLLSRVTRSHVTVSLSGDGADELFGGYSRYQLAPLIWNISRLLGHPGRSLAAGIMRTVPAGQGPCGLRWLGSVGKKYMNKGLTGDRLRKLARVMSAGTYVEVYRALMMSALEPKDMLRPPENSVDHDSGPEITFDKKPDARDLMMLDLSEYLPDDILTKIDRAAMGTSLETRMPFLDARIIEFACRLPLSFKIRKREGKWLLRQLLRRYVPHQLTDRPKMGFSVPLDLWLRGPLREWAEELLEMNRLRSEGFFQAEAVRSLWSDHLAGVRNAQRELWSILMFQAWRMTLRR